MILRDILQSLVGFDLTTGKYVLAGTVNNVDLYWDGSGWDVFANALQQVFGTGVQDGQPTWTWSIPDDVSLLVIDDATVRMRGWESGITPVEGTQAVTDFYGSITRDTLAYPLRTDIENIFGKTNVSRWADLENNQDVDDIEARVTWARVQATARMNDRLRGGPYAIPFDPAYPTMVVEMSARLAGAILYESRGFVDSTGEAEGHDTISVNRRMYEKWCSDVLAMRVKLDAPLMTSTTILVHRVPPLSCLIHPTQTSEIPEFTPSGVTV